MRAIGMSFFLFALLIVVSPLNAAAGVPDFFEELPRLLTSFTNSKNFNPLISRVSRQAPPSFICCGEVKFDLTPITDEFEGCMDEIGDLDKYQQEVCAYECAGKKLGLCDDEGHVKEEEFVEFCPQFVEGDDKLGEFVKALAEKVVEATRNIPEDKRNTQCNIDMLLASKGLHFHTILNCPPQLQNKAQECEELRAHLKKMAEQNRR